MHRGKAIFVELVFHPYFSVTLPSTSISIHLLVASQTISPWRVRSCSEIFRRPSASRRGVSVHARAELRSN